MGWDVFSAKEFANKAELIRYLTRPQRWRSGVSLVRFSVVGTNLWCLLEEVVDGIKYRAIQLTMLDPPRNGEGWGTKSVDEATHPAEVNCPLSFIEQAVPAQASDFAPEWRREVVQYHKDIAAARQLACALQAGSCIAYSGTDYRLVCRTDRGGWIVEHLDGRAGKYKMSAAQVLHSMKASLGASGRESEKPFDMAAEFAPSAEQIAFAF